MGSDHYLYYQRGAKKIEREDLDIKMIGIKKRDDKDQYEKSLEEIKECEPEGRWCEWDKSYVEEYEEYQKHKDDKYIDIEMAYYGKHWNLTSLILSIVKDNDGIESKDELYIGYEDTDLTKEMIEKMYKLHVEHFEGKSTLKDFCEYWSEEKEWKLEYSMNDLKAILDDKSINWEDDLIYYYEC